MMTIAAIRSAEQAASYYEADDYYAKDGSGRAPSAWYGAGARALGLEGEVDRQVCRKALAGELPGGTVLAGGQAGDRRPGWDCTFSAPKSVSIQALVGNDDRLVAAHEAAVRQAMAYIDAEIAGYREGCAGVTSRVPSDCIVVAQYRHDLSRNQDPQLHTHCLVINAVQRPDGQWRCFDARRLYKQQMTVGAVYRAALARRVVDLGFSIRVEHGDGRFELSHISREQIETFSTRRADIEEELRQQGFDFDASSARQREIAALSSRATKGCVDRAVLGEEWRIRAKEAGISFAAQRPSELSDGARRSAVVAAVEFAIAHKMERSATAEAHELLAAALGHAQGAATIDDVRGEIHARVSAGELIKHGDVYTSVQGVRLESEILRIASEGKGATAQIVPQSWFTEFDDGVLNETQREAVRTILTSQDRISAINGGAGTGKTTVLRHIAEHGTLRGYRIMGVAPSAVAARELSRTGISSETIAAFLARAPALDVGTVVVLDEAGMVGVVDMHAVLSVVEGSGARAVLVGDCAQLKAVSAGAPFEQLQEAGVRTARLSEIVRQTNPKLKEAVGMAAEGNVSGALGILRATTAEIPDAAARWDRIARQYISLAPKEREGTLIVTGTNSARDEINARVRRLLGLEGTGSKINILRALNLTAAEKKCTGVYTTGRVVIPNKSYRALKWAQGAQAEVVGVSAGKVSLRCGDGSAIEWQPSVAPNVSVYTRAEIEIAEGDRVRVTMNDYAADIRNGDVLKVEEIDKRRHELVLQAADGAMVRLSFAKPIHVEHAYAFTVHSTQGTTSDRVIVDACTRSATANEAAFYVAISRAREHASIYTDDLAGLPEAMSRVSEKTRALDVARPVARARHEALV